MKKLLVLSKANEEHTMFHIALKPDGKLQDIMCVPMQFDNTELLQTLLQTDRLGGQIHDVSPKEGYFFMYDNGKEKPYPSVMIWKYEFQGAMRYITDVGKEDLSIIPYAAETYLR